MQEIHLLQQAHRFALGVVPPLGKTVGALLADVAAALAAGDAAGDMAGFLSFETVFIAAVEGAAVDAFDGVAIAAFLVGIGASVGGGSIRVALVRRADDHTLALHAAVERVGRDVARGDLLHGPALGNVLTTRLAGERGRDPSAVRLHKHRPGGARAPTIRGCGECRARCGEQSACTCEGRQGRLCDLAESSGRPDCTGSYHHRCCLREECRHDRLDRS